MTETTLLPWLHSVLAPMPSSQSLGPVPSFRPLPCSLSDRTPLEVFPIIIDCYSFKDAKQLLTAALVSRVWYPRAMSKLYSTVEIGSRRRYDLLVAQIRASSGLKGRLKGTHTDGISRFFISCFCLALLQRIIRAFPHLEQLALLDVPVSVSSSLPPKRTPVQIETDVRLKQLAVGLYDSPPDLQCLTSIVDWLVSSAICTSLGSMEIRVLRSDANEGTQLQAQIDQQVNRLLKTCGSSLTVFHADGRLYHYNSKHNTALRHLIQTAAIECIDMIPSTEAAGIWLAAANKIYAVLSTVRSCQLEHIVVCFDIGVDGPSGASWQAKEAIESCQKLDLRALHDVMVRPCFDMLKNVDIEAYIDGCHNGQDGWLAEELPWTLVPVIRQLFRPWWDRRIVKFSYRWKVVDLRSDYYSKDMFTPSISLGESSRAANDL
ncbi:uncharacterized protein B0H18DRAFT_1102513 [Fomitopsis serialis]|uniref:uncharacterized protein n=1 Tax=Fomitopsis serialis TaxID=139415 RepID=UPI00200820E1|nr:uncharacterized protein B0H18DRAFT_1102513 [Neoantrodia serialis]KAH9931799.1 hypothetical protein B0H18DRAFT_1102513 [Neoantrodia serialis]